MTTFVIGRVNVPDYVRISTTLFRPSEPVYVLITRTSNHSFGGKLSDNNNVIYFNLTLRVLPLIPLVKLFKIFNFPSVTKVDVGFLTFAIFSSELNSHCFHGVLLELKWMIELKMFWS